MKKNDVSTCPDENKLAEFIEGKVLKQEDKDIFLHIANCPRCKDLCTFAAREQARVKGGKKIVMSRSVREKFQKQISELLGMEPEKMIVKAWNIFQARIVPVFEYLEGAEVIAASEVHSVIEFSSVAKETPRSWKAQLIIPSQLTESLKILVTAGENDKCQGKLILCGNVLEIKEGKGGIAYDVLRKSFHDPEIAFIFEDGEQVIGYPEL